MATFVAVLVVDKFGRRLLLIVSDLFMALALFALGVYFYMDENIDPNCNNATQTILIEVNISNFIKMFLSVEDPICSFSFSSGKIKMTFSKKKVSINHEFAKEKLGNVF